MKKNKLTLLLFLLVGTIILGACSLLQKGNQEEIKPDDKAQESQDDKKAEEDKKAKEAEEAKKAEEDKKAKEAEEAKKAEEDKKAKEAEEAKKAEEDKKTEDQKKTDKATSSDQPKIENQILGFNNAETKNLREQAKKIGVTLIDSQREDPIEVNINDLEAISIFEKKDSYGWICKYADNRIGVAEIPHETVTDENGNTYKPIQMVKVWDEGQIFQGRPTEITNNDPEMYKRFAKDIEKLYFGSEATVKHLFD